MIVDGVQCSRPGSLGSRTGRHVIRDDGSREFCPTCDCQPLALARIVRRSWWRRLLVWRPWAPAALPWELLPAPRPRAWYPGAGPVHRPPPVPRSLPSDGMPCAR